MKCILLVDFVTSISFHNYAIHAANIFTSARIKVNHCEPFWYDADGRKLTVMVYKHLYCYESVLLLLLLFASSPMEFVATLSNDEFYRLKAISSNLSSAFFSSYIRTDTRICLLGGSFFFYLRNKRWLFVICKCSIAVCNVLEMLFDTVEVKGHWNNIHCNLHNVIANVANSNAKQHNMMHKWNFTRHCIDALSLDKKINLCHHHLQYFIKVVVIMFR